MKNFIIFLDFDGVLHGSISPKFFANTQLLAKFLEPYPFVQIVLSTSWRESYSIDRIKEECIPELASRVIGVTPIFKDHPKGIRAKEVEQYVKDNNLHYTQYVCIDDLNFLFYEEFENLILTDPHTGLNDDTLHQLDEKIKVFNKKSFLNKTIN
jgi:hypothetical protein